MRQVRTLLAGRGLLESPRWVGGHLVVSDWSSGEVLAVDHLGTVRCVASVPSLPLCTAPLPDGRLVIVDSPRGRLLSLAPDGHVEQYAELGRPGWNDVVADGRGNVYVNGAAADPTRGEFAPGEVVLVRPDGSVSLVADDIAFPNGMAVTADGTGLVVADSYGHVLVGFAIGRDGGLSDRRVWADLGDAFPDGICLDAENAAWYADVPNQRCVRVAEGGTVLDTVGIDRGAFACILGGPDRRTLVIAAARWRGMSDPDLVTPGSGTVYCVDVAVPGAGWP